MGYLVGAYVVFLGLIAVYTITLLVRRRRVEAEVEELRSAQARRGRQG